MTEESKENKQYEDAVAKRQRTPIYDVVQLKTTGWMSHLILWVTLLFFVVALLWANFATLDEVTRADGKVIPSRQVQVVQSLEGGIVKEILVREGQTVLQGAPLLRIEDTKFSSDYREGTVQADALNIKISRLHAELEGKDFVVPLDLVKEAPGLVRSERLLFLSRQNELQQLKHRLALLEEEEKMLAPLVDQGAASKVEVLRVQQKLGELRGRIQLFRSTALQELNDAKSELKQVTAGNLSLRDRLERTTVRSPVHGIVKQVHVSTVGGVVKSGVALVEVVPLDDTLLVEARVRPSDIGFVYPGQAAKVKITAYDFSIYGGLEGNVEHISADTTEDEDGDSYYEIWVRTGSNVLTGRGKTLRIIPGMTATVDILTGKKTVLDYLLKPVLKAKHSALRER